MIFPCVKETLLNYILHELWCQKEMLCHIVALPLHKYDTVADKFSIDFVRIAGVGYGRFMECIVG